MSIDYRTYVGPYVRCGVGTQTIRSTRRSCPNTSCPNYGAYMPKGFCPTCGTEISEVTFEEPADAVDDWTVREVISDRLTTASGDGYLRWVKENHAHLWVANVTVPWRDCHMEERTDFNLVEITPEQVLEERRAFSVFFQQELAAIREHYGTANVTLHWGIVQDYS